MKVEFGGREEGLPGYMQIDLAKDKNIDLIADVSKPLPFQDNSLEEIFNSHLIEHIPWYETIEALKEWHRVLKKGGLLEIWTIDFAVICREYLKKDWQAVDGFYHKNPDKQKQVWVNCRLFWEGWQGNHSEWHKAVFDYPYLKYCLEKSGFEEIERVEGKSKSYDHGAINLGVRAFKRR